jgi:hypothetical protein
MPQAGDAQSVKDETKKGKLESGVPVEMGMQMARMGFFCNLRCNTKSVPDLVY